MKVEYLHRLGPDSDCSSLCGFSHAGILRYCTMFAPGKKPEITGDWDLLVPCPACEENAAALGLEPRRSMTKTDCLEAGGFELLQKCAENPQIATVEMMEGACDMVTEARKKRTAT